MIAFNRQDFNADVSSKMDELRSSCTQLSDSDSDAKVFCYLAADLLDTTDESVFHYTDGPNDLGIDFYTHTGNAFQIYQCKSTNLSNHPNGKVFGSDPVNELIEAVDFVLGEERLASHSVQKLKNLFQLNPQNNRLTATLVLEGALSDSALEHFNNLKSEYRNRNVELRLADEKTLFNTWHSFDDLAKPRDVELKLRVDGEGLLKMQSWFCAVIRIDTLLSAIEKYGNGLFDLNVRSNLRKSRVNAAIRNTISTQKGQKQFIHLNNGLVIICTSFSYSSDNSQITLKGAQVINGCQTLSTIWDYFLNADNDEKIRLQENLRIFVKVIDNSKISNDKRLLDEIIVASNNQNPMNERNLKSNSVEQRSIQISFYQQPLKPALRYFYIRKDGEFDSLLNSTQKEPKKRYFEINGSKRRGANRYRHLDNEELAKIWWSWIGNAHSVNSGSVKLFSDSTYPHIFMERPSDTYWDQLSSTNFTYRASQLEELAPTQYQYLTAYGVSKYIEALVKKESATSIRKRRVDALIADRIISANANEQEISDALREDADYLNASWLRQMTYTLTEVASFVFLRKYDSLNSEVCKRVLDFEDMSYWLEHGTDQKLLDAEEMRGGILERSFEFVRQSTESYFANNRSAILVENRPKLFLGRREVISELKRTCLKFDQSWKKYPSESGLKEPGKTFLESLPELK